MKHGKRPTKKVKEMLSEKRLNPKNWLVERQTNEVIVVIHKETGTLRKMAI